MGDVRFDGELANSYPFARRLMTSTMDAWAGVMARHVPSGPAPVLDLGSGTGRFSEALATALQVSVLAVEPSADMRRLHAASSPFILRVGGRAEAIPCASRAVKAVWASQVLHHVDDVAACAREMSRVLRRSGRILLRGGFTDETRPPRLHEFFPSLSRFSEEAASALAAAEVALAANGLVRLVHETIEQITALSLRELHNHVQLRGRSPLRRLSDDEFARGLEHLRIAAMDVSQPASVRDHVDLFVFGTAE